MPRSARIISRTGFYHVIIRGVNKENIFIDDEDRRNFLHLLKYYKTELKCRIHAYCLMSNHVHILIEDNNNKLGELMKNITSVYAGEFNKKYNRIGHLFQDRFKSQNIENQNYLLTVIRYINRNPEKAKICKAEKYKWSSYNEIIYGSKIVERDFVLSLYSDNKFYAINEFKNQITVDYNDVLDSAYINDKISDKEATELLEHIIKTKQIPEIKKENLSEVVYKIQKIKNMSKEQIFRILGINKNQFYYMSKK